MSKLRHVTGVITIVAMLATSTGHAQPAAPPPPTAPTTSSTATLEAFLQQRVVEELATDGIVLSRLGVMLELEAIDTRLLVSLVDPTTGRAVASTKIDELPADRDAAVATVTPVVANLVAELAGRPHDDGTAERLDQIERNQREQIERAEIERAERAELARAERQYEEEAIRFDREIAGALISMPAGGSGLGYGAVGYRWSASRGDSNIPLEGASYYEVVERPDLARSYRRRRKFGFVGLLVSGGLLIASLPLLAHTQEVTPDYSQCQPSDFACQIAALNDAESEAREPDAVNYLGATAMLGGLVLCGVAVWYLLRPHPVSEGEARRLGAAHNRKLRKRLGLPVADDPGAPGHVTWAPYVSGDGAGLALSARF